MTVIQQRLQSLAQPEYKAFQCKLMPTVDPNTVLGVRTPALRALAKELKGTPAAKAFLQQLPHTYYEENNLHGFLIETITDYDQAVEALDAFLPHINNWATCDSVAPKVLCRHLPALKKQIKIWLDSPHPYTVRYAIGMLQRHFLGKAFHPADLEWVASAAGEEYYINMMIAWYFATALAKQPSAVLPLIEHRRLPVWIHNKAIQKAVESRRISPEVKQRLRQLKIR